MHFSRPAHQGLRGRRLHLPQPGRRAVAGSHPPGRRVAGRLSPGRIPPGGRAVKCRRHVRFGSLLAGLALLVAQTLSGAGAARPAYPSHFTAEPTDVDAACDGAGLVAIYCAGCHQSGRARIDFDGPIDFRAIRADRPTWEKVLEAVRDGKMPPKRWMQPTEADRRRIVAWIEQGFAAADAAANRPRWVRRLLGREYVRAAQDLLGADRLPDLVLPPDDAGWDPADEPLELPAPLRPTYAAAADALVGAFNDSSLTAAFAPAEPDLAESGIPRALAAWARRAYRRPLSAAEAAELHAVFVGATRGPGAVADGLRAALKHVLTSPAFLYLRETGPAPGTDAPAGEEELASRISFLLWGTTPDEKLLDLAGRSELRPQLAAQVSRLLADARSGALAEELADGWLGLAALTRAEHVDPSLRTAMRAETTRLLACVIRENRSVLELLDADYSFVNEALANHYGIPGVAGAHFRRVSLAGTPRAGLLTHASVLTITAPGGVPSAVQRGKWLLTSLLGEPPPAPPAGLLEAFNQVPREGTQASQRETLARHRAHASCAHCHAPIDGLGLALEHFDSQGAWRPAADASAGEPTVLPDGAVLRGPADLRDYLVRRRASFVRALAGKLLEMATGRKLRSADAVALDDIVTRVLPEPRFARLVAELVQSGLFAHPARP